MAACLVSGLEYLDAGDEGIAALARLGLFALDYKKAPHKGAFEMEALGLVEVILD